VKKWIETGAPVDLMGKLQMLIGDSGSSNLQRLFAGMITMVNKWSIL